MPDLKNCPGCGKNQTRLIGGPGTAGGPKYWCGCDFCHWRTWGDTSTEAIEVWNRRAGDGTREAIEAEIVAWLRDDADQTEIEARAIVRNTTGNARQNAAEWAELVAIKRGLASAIERGEYRSKSDG